MNAIVFALIICGAGAAPNLRAIAKSKDLSRVKQEPSDDVGTWDDMFKDPEIPQAEPKKDEPVDDSNDVGTWDDIYKDPEVGDWKNEEEPSPPTEKPKQEEPSEIPEPEYEDTGELDDATHTDGGAPLHPHHEHEKHHPAHKKHHPDDYPIGEMEDGKEPGNEVEGGWDDIHHDPDAGDWDPDAEVEPSPPAEMPKKEEPSGIPEPDGKQQGNEMHPAPEDEEIGDWEDGEKHGEEEMLPAPEDDNIGEWEDGKEQGNEVEGGWDPDAEVEPSPDAEVEPSPPTEMPKKEEPVDDSNDVGSWDDIYKDPAIEEKPKEEEPVDDSNDVGSWDDIFKDPVLIRRRNRKASRGQF